MVTMATYQPQKEQKNQSHFYKEMQIDIAVKLSFYGVVQHMHQVLLSTYTD
jgi:hypothetical protein